MPVFFYFSFFFFCLNPIFNKKKMSKRKARPYNEQKRKFNADDDDIGPNACAGFVLDGKTHHLAHPENFDFFSGYLESGKKLFLCLDDSKCADTEEYVIFPINIKQPLDFIFLCNSQESSAIVKNKFQKKSKINNKLNAKIKYEQNFNWLIALQWLMAKSSVFSLFKNNLESNYDSWMDFDVVFTEIDKDKIETDLVYAIKMGCGEDFTAPIDLHHDTFATKMNIPVAIVKIVAENKDNCGIFGSSCLDFGIFPSSDVDIFVYCTDYSNLTIRNFVSCLLETHDVLRLSSSVLTCIGNKKCPVKGSFYRNIQIVSSVQSNALDVIRGFDVDCVKLYYDGTKIHKTRLCCYALENQVCSFPRDSLVFNAKRLVKYAVKGFKLTPKEIECVKFTLGEWPLSENTIAKTKYDFPSFNPFIDTVAQFQQYAKYTLEEIFDFSEDLLLPMASYYKVTVDPNLFRGSMEAYVETLHLNSPKLHPECAIVMNQNYSFQLHNLECVLFSNFPKDFRYGKDFIVPEATMVFPKYPTNFKMQTNSHAMNYAHLHDMIVQKLDQRNNNGRLRSGKRFRTKQGFLDKTYRDIVVYFSNCKVYQKGRFLQNGIQGVPINSKMHVIAVPQYINSLRNLITWHADQIFLLS